MKRILFLLLAGALLSDGPFVKVQPEYFVRVEDAPSEIEGREDRQGRLEYELLLTADPKTGKVPPGIKEAELAFSNNLVERTRRMRTQALDISQDGPFNVGGRTRAVAFDVRNEEVILAGGVSGGIWKSTDGGATWVRKSDPKNRNSVTCLVQDTRPGHEDTWYHGTGELVGNSTRGGGAPFRGNGIYKSTDNGETWNVIPSTLDSDPNIFNSQFQYIWDIVVNTQNLVEDEVLIAAYGGILRSTDGGDSWSVSLGQELFGLADDVDLNESNASFYTSIVQSASGIFYATLSTASSSDVNSEDAGMYMSRNGTEWLDITPFTAESEYRRIVMGTSESDPEVCYFLIDSNPIFILRYTIQQFDDLDTVFNFSLGSTPNFEDLGAFNTQGSYNMMIKVHPQDPDIVFTGGTNLYRTTDGFASDANISWVGGYTTEGGSAVYPNHHPDQHELLFYPSNPSKILSANDGGLRVSQDALADSVIWSSLNNGYITSQFFTIAQSQESGNPTLIGGMQDNGTYLTLQSGQADWLRLLGGDGGYAATTKGDLLWFASFQRGQTLRLTFGDGFRLTSFGRVDPAGLVAAEGSSYLFVNPFILDPNNQNRMFIAGGNHLYYHPNVSQIPGGSQEPTSVGWEKVSTTPLVGGVVSAIDIAKNSEKLYFGSSNGALYRLSNADDFNAFELTVISSPIFPENGYVSSISVNPDNEDHLLVVFSNYNIPSVFVSTDGGSSFVDISGNLEQNPDGTGNGPSIRWGEVIPKNSGVLYLVGTSTGLYSTETLAGGATIWVKESTDMIGSAIIPMMDYRASDGRLVVATHGNGVFVTNISDFKPVVPTTTGENFSLVRAAPNPFQDNTTIRYSIPENGIVRVDIYTVNGQLINNILWAPQFAGVNEISWDGTNTSGTTLANGIYLYRIQYNGETKGGRLMLSR